METQKHVDFGKLVPEVSDWNDGNGISIEDWVACTGNFELAIGYSRLFWPEFVEHDGCVFFADFATDSYRAFMDHCEGDRCSVERVMNHRHIFAYFSHHNGTATVDQILYLGRALKEMWRIKLAHDFPDRAFIVSFPEDPQDDLGDYEISFWQARGT